MSRSEDRSLQRPDPIPASAGVGLRAPHYRDALAEAGDVAWFEVHPENYMGDGGPPHRYLGAVRENFPLSMHGVGLSIAGEDRPDAAHLGRLQSLLERYQPALFSEHLAWTTASGEFLNDLLPVMYDDVNLNRVVAHIDEVQDVLDREILIENPATYLRFADDLMAETDFLAALASRTGCGLLLDVNNVLVSASNHQYSAVDYIANFPIASVQEIHVAGHRMDESVPEDPVMLDSHDCEVAESVWDLLQYSLSMTGPVPVLVEWDTELPDWSILLGQAQRANQCLAIASDSADRERAIGN